MPFIVTQLGEDNDSDVEIDDDSNANFVSVLQMGEDNDSEGRYRLGIWTVTKLD